MSNRLPKDRTIRIHVDADRQHKFHYTDLFTGKDASSLVLINGDRLAWVLDASIPERTFQIDFGVVNPFHIGTPVSLRGVGYVVSPDVRFRNTYVGVRKLKYTVTLANGWVDDPDVVPVPADAGTIVGLTAPKLDKISWTDNTESAIIFDHPYLTADASSSDDHLAALIWQWADNQPDTQPFTLQFSPDDINAVPPGWPSAKQDSVGAEHPSIPLFLPKGLDTPTVFRITLTTPDGITIHKDGTILIS